jgi:GNAT superfamily N-acetyltransferase
MSGRRPCPELPFERSRLIPHVDDLPVWSLWYARVRPGHRGQGMAPQLVNGAVGCARSKGAPAVEGYSVDNGVNRVNLTRAFVGHAGDLRAGGVHQGG